MLARNNRYEAQRRLVDERGRTLLANMKEGLGLIPRTSTAPAPGWLAMIRWGGQYVSVYWGDRGLDGLVVHRNYWVVPSSGVR